MGQAKSGWINHTSGVEFISAGSRYDVKEFSPQVRVPLAVLWPRRLSALALT